MQKRIGFIGYGELGKQFHSFVKTSAAEFLFFDDVLLAAQQNNAFNFNSYSEEQFQDCEFAVSLGYSYLKKKKQILDHLLQLQRKLFSFVHASTYVNPSAEIGSGSFIYPMCNVDKHVKIGKGVLINNSVCLSHNCVVGDCSYLSPGIVTSGFVEIGECTFIGAGSVISDHVRIGANVIVGIGSVITDNVPDNASIIGNPARLLSRPLNLGSQKARISKRDET